jgi:hypothetical protein
MSLKVHAQTCGGTERWQVKVGTDSGAGSVQLSPIVQTTLQDAIHLPQPQLPPQNDNDTRLPEEVHVYQLQGRLAQFKQETNDNDYHIVITDDTLQFTNDPAHHGTGHSLIAEVPDPGCIPGKHGDPSVPSRFIAQITCTRNKMDAKFPNADKSGNFNDGGNIPVTITGIGFFDRAHNQTGRASNNLEIHSLLDIDFGDGQPSCFQGVLPTGDFSVSAVPATLTVAPGASGTVALNVNPTNGFSGTVSFAVSGLPTGVTSTVTATAGGGSTLTLAAAPTASQGVSSLTVTGMSGALSHNTSVQLTVGTGAAGKWEYKVITASTPDALVTQANALGAQGWELAGVAFDSSRPDSYVGFMKRAVTQ